MALKVLHTADWHIGQTFYEYDRYHEHEQFLSWLNDTIVNENIDVLLISGDIFDVSNPAAVSIKLFYSFLASVCKARPGLQIIITAGNHDSPSRLEAPNPFLEAFNISIIGNVQRKEDEGIDYEKLVIPVKDSQGKTQVWCMAIPFLRPGDYPFIENADSSYVAGVMAVYKEAYSFARNIKKEDHAIIAMGHLHTLDAQVTDDDKNERLIMGGVEFVPASVFDGNIAYTALGHIHKAQKIGGKENVRYSGSPLPMSFSEARYKHQVILFEIENGKAFNIKSLEIPVTVKLLRVPAAPKKLNEVLDELQLLEEAGAEAAPAPYLEVRILLDGPEPSLRHKIESALKDKYVRLAKIDVAYPKTNHTKEEILTFDEFHELKPISVFNRIYKTRYDHETPGELVELFNQAALEVSAKEN